MAPAMSACALVSGILSVSQAFRVARAKKDCYSPLDGKQLLGLTACTEELVEQLMAVECEHLTDEGPLLPAEGCAKWQAVCSEEAAGDVAARFGKQAHVLSADAGSYFRQSSGVSHAYAGAGRASGSGVDRDFYKDWRNLDDRMAKVQAAVDASGGAATIETIGMSTENRPIKAVRMTGQGYSPGKPKVIFNFNLHAREWLGGMAGIYATENMVAKAASDPSWLAGMELVLVPMSNPDGFVYSDRSNRMWRKNRRPKSGFFGCDGVDLNRNFPKDFGGRGSTSGSTCSDVYTGPSALSEPEAQALDKIIREAPLTVHVDIHAFSQLILTPWSWTSDPHPRSDEINDLGSKMSAAVEAKHGKKYPYGDNLLYTASGVLADYTTELGALGFTYEVRPASQWGTGGFAPPAAEILPTAEEVLEGLYVGVAWAKAQA